MSALKRVKIVFTSLRHRVPFEDKRKTTTLTLVSSSCAVSSSFWAGYLHAPHPFCRPSRAFACHPAYRQSPKHHPLPRRCPPQPSFSTALSSPSVFSLALH